MHALVSYHGEQRKQCAPHKCRMHVPREFLYLLRDKESSDVCLPSKFHININRELKAGGMFYEIYMRFAECHSGLDYQ